MVQFVNGKPLKLEPVIIFENGNFEDATLYQAGPLPMAIQPGTVYEVQREGVPLGLFTIQQPEQEKNDWYAKGSWTSQSEIAAAEAAKAAQAKAKEAKKPRPLILQKDERPVLRHGGSDSSSPTASSAPPPPPGPTSPGKPVATSGAGSENAPPPTASNSTSVNANVDAESAEATAPGRPVLRRRGTKGEQVSETEAASKAAASKRTAVASKVSPAAGTAASAAQWLPAVSDPAATDQRPYKFMWAPEQQATLTRKMGEMALRELQTYLRDKGLVLADSTKPEDSKKAARKSVGVKNSSVANNWPGVEVRAFDLYYDNDAELVLSGERAVRKAGTARAEPDAKAYVTLVAFMDANNDLHKCKVEVTDDSHLDVQGKLELIDAVDATGDTRGELLFRRAGRGSNHYELYRVYPDTVYKLFDSAQPVR